MHNNVYQLVRVAYPKSVRAQKLGMPHPKFGEKVEMGIGTARVYEGGKGTTGFKAAIGGMGLMMQEDFDSGNYAPYGLTDRDIVRGQAEVINKVAETMVKNADLEKENAKLMAEIEALKTEPKPKRSRAKKGGEDESQA